MVNETTQINTLLSYTLYIGVYDFIKDELNGTMKQRRIIAPGIILWVSR